MIIRHDGKKPTLVFGMSLQPGVPQPVRDGLPPDKVAYLKAHFTVIDEPQPCPPPPKVVRKRVTKKTTSRRFSWG